jgi:LysR family transcriptional regulator, nitrogen assimilation regulatory protein
MDFKDLHTFAVVARMESFSKAALSLRIAQSALSRRVERLEHQFSLELLERHSRGARPTEVGLILLSKIEHLENEMRKVKQDMLSLKTQLSGEIRLVLPHGVVQFLGSRIVEKYREKHPGIKLTIIEGTSACNYQAVLEGTADVGLVYDLEAMSDMVTTPLFIERRLLVGPAQSQNNLPSLSNLVSYDATELSKLPLILPVRPHSIRLAVENAARRCGISLNVTLEVDGLSALKTLVKNGLGYTVLPYGPVHPEIASGALVAVPIINPRLECLVEMVHRKDRQNSRAMQSLNSIVREILLSNGVSPFWRAAEEADVAPLLESVQT